MTKRALQILWTVFSVSFAFLANAQFAGGNADGNSDEAVTNTVCSSRGLNLFSGGAQEEHSDVSMIRVACASSATNLFAGGNNDGHSDLALIRMACTTSGLNLFAGGNEDGHSDIALLTTTCVPLAVNPFSGGQEDGHSDIALVRSNCAAVGVNPFFGGNNDGHSDIGVVSTLCSTVGVNPYSGGNNDGHSDISLLRTTCAPLGANPFLGGNYDGHSDVVLTVTSCMVALPVQLLHFDASCENSTVQLNWATATENNNDYFVVERSDNEAFFSTIAKIKGSGNTNAVKHYSFSDINPASVQTYYRLSQVDYDGKSTYMNVISSLCGREQPSAVLLSPNPNAGNFTIEGFGETAALSIYNTVGEIVFQSSLENNQSELKLSKLASGIYYVVTRTAARSHISKMILTK